MAERIRLSEDLDTLFPGSIVTIGTQKIEIRPLGVAKLASIFRKLKAFGTSLGDEGVTWDNYSEHQNVIKIATSLLEQFPDVLEEATNIAAEDLQRLPLEVIAEVLSIVLEVNLSSKESLSKNFNGLIEKFNKLTTDQPKKKEK